MNLHLIARVISPEQLKESIQRLVQPNDSLLLISDSVLSLLNSEYAKLLLNYPVYALHADVQCRGLSKQLPSQIHVIFDNQMVELSTTHNQVISW